MPPKTEDGTDRLNLYLPAEMRERIRQAAAARHTSESATAVWLLARSLDWYESLSDGQREAV